MQSIAKNPNIIFEPLAGAQRLVMSCPVNQIFIHGNRGGGKSLLLLMKFAKYVGKGYGSNWRGIIFRTEFKELEDIISKSKDYFYRIFPNAQFKESTKSYKWVFPDGETLYFRSGKTESDYRNYHGHEYPFIGFEELTNWADSSFYFNMMTCNRSSRKDMPRFMVSNSNPYGIGHQWVKDYFISPDPIGGRVISDPNGKNRRVAIRVSLLENTVMLASDPDYVYKLMQQKRNKAIRLAWLFGDWNIEAGGYFENYWDSRYNIIEPFDIPPTWYINRSFDWGKSKPFSTGWWAESDGSDVMLRDGSMMPTIRGDLFRIFEWYGCKDGERNVGLQMPSPEVGRRIVKYDQMIRSRTGIEVDDGVADSQIFASEDTETIAGKMKVVGCNWKPSVKGKDSRKKGFQLMADMMYNAKSREGAGLFVFSNCSAFIRTVPTLVQDQKDMDDIDTTQEDHIADETRYRVMLKVWGVATGARIN
jgi:hypothetical protein